MPEANFPKSLHYVLENEGGNDDDPDDHGGRTSRAWRGSVTSTGRLATPKGSEARRSVPQARQTAA